ncbi:MAG: hypothetical protein ACI4JA_11700 [Oscillospiraceae bacterium]
MAKYEVKFSCGHTGTVELFGKTEERYRKLEYFERQGLCSECYKEMMSAQEAQTPLGVTVELDPYVDKCFTLVFTGDTKPVKDRIKALGFRWTEKSESSGMFGVLSTKSYFAWCKDVSEQDLSAEQDKIKEAFPEIQFTKDYSDIDIAAYHKVQQQRAESEAIKQEKISALEKPVKPDCLPDGYFNGKVYGKNRYSVYVDNKKIDITEEEKQSIEEYAQKLAEYNKAVKQIKEEN